MAYPTAIGCGCLLGAGGASHVRAAEWTLQPVLSSLVDYDSSRNISTAAQGSEQAVLTADLQLTRSMENTLLMLEPHFDVRRYSDSVWGPGNDRSLTGAFTWAGERAKLNLNGSIANQNILTTELLETGIAESGTRRRYETAGAELDLTQTEKRVLFTQLNFIGSTYFGPLLVHELLPGYRYDAAAIGERFLFTENLTFSVSAFGDILHSERSGASSHEAGGQVELNYAHSERMSFDVQLGQSRRVLSGTASNGTNVAITATRNYEVSSVSLSFTRSLTPYGNGFLVERQQVLLSGKHSFTPYLDGDLTATRIQNNDSTVRLGLDRKFYDNLGGGLNWRFAESWTLRGEATTSWAPPFGVANHTLHEWRAALVMTWKPLQQIFSR